MSEQNQLSAVQRIDLIAKDASAYFDQAGSMEAELKVAVAIGDLRVALTDEIMRPIMALMNTDIGFDTDHNPNRPDKQGNRPAPYPIEVVRDFVIQAKLRGFHLIGNECNIISGKFYATKAGCSRKAKNWEGVTDMVDNYSVPRMMEGGALVKCSATWKYKGKPQSIERDFPIKVNTFMGSDAILGKAQRKLFAAILFRLSGKIMPDGDSNDPEQIEPAKEHPQPGEASTVDAESAQEWREVEVHLKEWIRNGKRIKLGTLPDKPLRALVESWNPPKHAVTGLITASDMFLRKALDNAAIELGMTCPPQTK